jgi:hypothetical protein
LPFLVFLTYSSTISRRYIRVVSDEETWGGSPVAAGTEKDPDKIAEGVSRMIAGQITGATQSGRPPARRI